MKWQRSKLRSRDSVSFPRNHLQKWCERLRHKLVVQKSRHSLRFKMESRHLHGIRPTESSNVGDDIKQAAWSLFRFPSTIRLMPSIVVSVFLKQKYSKDFHVSSPVTIQTPSKPRFIVSRIVGIEIDVYAGYSAIAKFENVAETSARSFATRPGFTGHFPL